MPQVMTIANPSLTLNPNEIYGVLANMLISQYVNADNIKGLYSSLVERAKVDGSLYGDQKLYYDTDALSSRPWGVVPADGDQGLQTEASNLLQLERPKAPLCQSIVLNKFRQIGLTLDEYLTKRFWMEEGSFSKFQSVMQGWLNATKRIYEATTYNAFLGTDVSTKAEQNKSINLYEIEEDASLNTEEKSRREGLTIAQSIADLFVELKDISRDYNDYGVLRSYDEDDLIVVWNSAWVNKIRSIDLPTIFHNEGLIKKFADNVLPERYFGTINTTTTIGAKTRALQELTLVAKKAGSPDHEYHFFAGDLIALTADDATAGYAFTGSDIKDVSYNVDDKVICKIMHRESVPFMSAFSSGTSFFNPRALVTTYYITWGHNTLEHLLGKPYITIKAVTENPNPGN